MKSILSSLLLLLLLFTSQVSSAKNNPTTGAFSGTIDPKPSAGPNQTILCGSSTTHVILTGTLPTTGVWTSMASNDSTAKLGTNLGGVVIVTLPLAPYIGKLSYIYTTTGGIDTVSIYVNGPNSPAITVHTGSLVLCGSSTVQLCPVTFGFSIYQWYKDGYLQNQTGSCITVDSLGIGSYSLAGTNGAGCLSQKSLPLVVGTLSTIAIPTITLTGAASCKGGIDTLKSSSSTGNLWFKNGNSTGVTTQSYAVSDAADYTVLVSSGSCSSAMSSIETVSGIVRAGFSFTNATSNCDSTIKFTSTSAGTTSKWDFGNLKSDTGNIVINKYDSATSFSAKQTVTNSIGCTDSITQTIYVTSCSVSTQCTAPKASFTISNATQCLANNSFSFSNTTTGNALTYSWNFGDNSPIVTTTAAGHSYSAAQVYNVKLLVTNSCGKDSITKTVTVDTTLAQPKIVNGSNSIIVGNTITLTDSTINGVWKSDNTSIATIDSFGVVNALTAGNAIITYTVSNSCGSLSSRLSITVTAPAPPAPSCAPPIAGFTISNATQCLSSNSFSFSNTTTGNVLTYSWNFGDSSSIVTTTAAGYSYKAAKVYNVQLLVTNSCGRDSIAKTVTVNVAPVQPSIINGRDSIIVGNTITLTDSTINGVWKSDNTSVATIDSLGVVNALTAGSATISYTLSNSCGSPYSSLLVTVTAVAVIAPAPCTPPTANFTIDSANYCLATNTFNFTNTSTGTALTYRWYFGETGVETTTTNAKYSYLNANTYTVSLIASNACGSNTLTKTITVTTVPVTPSSISGSSSIVVGATTVLSSATSGGLWISNDNTIATVDNNGVVTALKSGKDTITYTVSNSCGFASTFLIITVSDPCTTPIANFTIDNSIQCLGTNNFNFTNNSTGTKLTYRWYFGETGLEATSTDTNYTYTHANTYKVTLIASNACGSNQITKTVTVTTVQNAPSIISSTSNLAVGATTTLTSATLGGVWTSNNTAIATIDVNGIVTASTIGIDTIKYTVTNSCGSNYGILSLTVTAVATIPVTPQSPAPCSLNASFSINTASQCLSGNQYVLTSTTTGGTAPFTYLWDLNDATIAVTKNVTKVYAASGERNVTLKVSDSNGCVSSSPVQQLYVLASPKASFTVLTHTGNGKSTTFISSSTIASGIMSYLWDFQGGSTSTLVNPTIDFVVGSTHLVTLIVTGNSTGSCKDTAVQSVTEKAVTNVRVYPNPVMNIIEVSFVSVSSTPTTFKLMDLAGRVMQIQTVTPSSTGVNILATLNTRGLQSGSYVLYISDEQNGFLATKTILKQ